MNQVEAVVKNAREVSASQVEEDYPKAASHASGRYIIVDPNDS
jgi:hypothetical protein